MAISHIVEDFISVKHLGKVKRKTLFFLIEITQNIEKYSEHDNDNKDWFLVYSNPGKITIESQNVIKNQFVDELRNQLENINSSSQEELKEMFTTKLSKSLSEDKKSPGLGFIELKRKNKKSFDFDFQKIDEHKSTFSLKVSIDDLTIEEGADSDNVVDDKLTNEILHIKKEFDSKDDIIVFSGDLSGSTVAPVVNLIEKVEFSDDLTLRSKYQHSLIELLQNSKEHSVAENEAKSGFLIVQKIDDNVIVGCCNKAVKYDSLLKEIEDLNNCTKDELKDYSKRALLNFEKEGGLGLIQVANLSHPSPLLSKTFYNANNETFLYIESKFRKD